MKGVGNVCAQVLVRQNTDFRASESLGSLNEAKHIESSSPHKSRSDD